eukprot:TRINITY_DN58662_c0_g1_i1.p1 TRINITY_DN58662_c0_g1~~TRINITY_DN58662_c0_g1_i1.p1  ORF type:complete len:191 (+),score=15.85 TRINITY_DN58662_c0_g1_i1:178-750(+)
MAQDNVQGEGDAHLSPLAGDDDEDEGSEYAWLRSALQDEPHAVAIRDDPTAASLHPPLPPDAGDRSFFHLRNCRRCGSDLSGAPGRFFWSASPGMLACRGCQEVHLLNRMPLIQAIVAFTMCSCLLVAVAVVEFVTAGIYRGPGQPAVRGGLVVLGVGMLFLALSALGRTAWLAMRLGTAPKPVVSRDDL